MASLRRLQQEWKEAILAGVAFDWVRGEPVVVPTQRKQQQRTNKQSKEEEEQQQQQQLDALSSSSVDNSSNNTNTTSTTNTTTATPKPSHIWIGPLNPRNLFIWHFSVRGLPGSVYQDGIYHGRIVLPHNYPDQPPRVQMLTRSGRFKPQVNICLSASHYHPEMWNPSQWSCRTIVESLRLHMCTPANEIGGCNESYEQRLLYAVASQHYQCPIATAMSGSSSSNNNQRTRMLVDHARMIQRGYIIMEPKNSKSACNSCGVDNGDGDDDKLAQQDNKMTTQTTTTTTTTEASSSSDLLEDTLHQQEDTRTCFPDVNDASIKQKKARAKNLKKKRKQALLANSASATATKPTATQAATHKQRRVKQQMQLQQRQQQRQQIAVPTTSSLSSHLVKMLRKTLVRIGLLAFVLLFCYLNRDFAIPGMYT